MFLIRVFYDLTYCQEKYFRTHFINKTSDKKAIPNYPPNNYCKPSFNVGDISLKILAVGESTLDELLRDYQGYRKLAVENQYK
jgi:hypothetical protein